MFGIGNIKVNASGKTKEELKEEIMKEVDKNVEEMFKIHEKIDSSHKKKKESKKQSKEPREVSLIMKEDEEGKGFSCMCTIEGDFNHIMTMLTVGVSRALNEISGCDDNQYNGKLLLQFVHALISEHMGIFQPDLEEEE